ncbi:hypothetical protein V5F53_11015 [Xanthobacter sp. V4C-4]|uniref:hypothetical protein n=1 Tax=Xanthobacter cornucopiae TaxID=3119924 RepID=UPI00372B7F0E
MSILYLTFPDRAAALAALAAALGYETSAEAPGGAEGVTCGSFGGTRYDLCFLADAGVIAPGGVDLVNLRWWGAPEAAPDFGAAVVAPLTPSAAFLEEV